MQEEISEIFAEIMAYAEALGVSRLNQRPGLWRQQLDDDWVFWVNPHASRIPADRGPEVAPYHCYVEFRGWPAGVVSPAGGEFAAGEAANEDTFLAALRAATERARASA